MRHFTYISTATNTAQNVARNFGEKLFLKDTKTKTSRWALAWSLILSFALLTISTNLYAQVDTDGDGIPNSVDLDDDNDGILDAVEAPGCYYTASEVNVIASIGTGLTISTGTLPLLYNGVLTTETPNFAFTAAQALVNANIFTVTYSTPVNLSSMTIVNNTSLGTGATARLQGSVDGTSWVNLTSAAVSISTTTNKVFTVNQNAGQYQFYRIFGVATATLLANPIFEITSILNASFNQSAYPKPTCTIDTDNDGITNNLDLDSDGDGCKDVLEGGAAFTTANTTAAGTTSGSVSNAVATLGVPTVAGSGQSIGTSQDAGVRDVACCETITNTAGNNTNPTTCSGSDGSIRLCGLTPNGTGYTINYDKNGTPASALTNQTADASGCITLTGLTAASYTNIKISSSACPTGSNAFSANLTDPSAPAAPIGLAGVPTSNICIGTSVELSAIVTAGATYTWTVSPAGAILSSEAGTISDITASNTLYNTAAGVYTVSLTQTLLGCTSAPATTTVTVNATPNTPVPTATSKSNVCPAPTVDLTTLQPAAVFGVVYEWHTAESNPTAGTLVTTPNAVAAGTYYLYGKSSSGCYSASSSAVTAIVTTCCPTITNTAGTNVNPSACNTPTGSIRICGLIPNGTGYTVNYDKNGTPATAVTNQTADILGCITLTALTAGSYTNVKISSTACPTGSNALSANLTDPPTPAAPTGLVGVPLSNFCIGTNVVLSATGTAGATYTWTVSPTGATLASAAGTISGTTASNTLSITAAGFYTVFLTQTISGCTSAPAITTVTVNATPSTPVPTATSTSNLCPAPLVDLTTLQAAAVFGVAYEWHTAASNPTAGTLVTTPSAAAAGMYYLYGKSSSGCYSASSSAVAAIVTNCCPTITNTAGTHVNPSACGTATGSIKLCGLTPNGTGYTINYNKNSTPAIAVTNQTADAFGCLTLTGLTAGSYTNINVSSSACPTGSSALNANLTDPPIPAAPTSLTGESTSIICTGTSVGLIATGTAGATYTWTVSPTGATLASAAGVISGTTASNTFNSTAAGIYSISLTQTVSGCTSAPATTTFTVLATPSMPVPTSTSKSNACPATLVDLTTLQAAAVSGVTYEWHMAASNPTAGTLVATPSAVAAGTYYLYGKSSSGCYSASSSAVTATVAICCPIITNTVGSNVNPSACNSATGSIRLCGLTPNGIGYTVNYDKNGTPATAVTNQTADASGCITLTSLTAANYTNIKVSISGCPAGGNALSAILIDPPTPAAPTSLVGVPTSNICVGTGVGLSATGTAGATYTWMVSPTGATLASAAGTISGTTASNVLNSTAAGIYTVFLTQTVLGCTSAPVTTTVMVNTTPSTPVPTATGKSNVCPATTVDLTTLQPAAVWGDTYEWHTVSSNPTAGTLIATPSALAAGTYYLHGKSSSGCYSASSSAVTATVTTCCPTITNTAGTNVNPSACGTATGSIKLCGLTPNGTGYTINYDKNGTPATAVTNQMADASGCITLASLTAGSYTNIKVSISACPAGGNALSAILIDPPTPAAPTSLVGVPTSNICVGTGVGLSATGTAGATYTWVVSPTGATLASVAGTISGTTASNVLNSTAAGIYTVFLTQTVSGCTSAPVTTTVMVNTTPTPVPTATSKSNACPATTVDLITLQPAAVSGVTYEWHTVSSNPTAATLIANPSALAAGTYYLHGKASSGCYSVSSSAVTATVTTCCPTITNTAGSHVNPSACGTATGSIKLCGLTPNGTGYNVNYNKNGTQATAVTNQAADASGCVTLTGLTAGSYTNINVSSSACPIGSTAFSVNLTDPPTPAAPTSLMAVSSTNICVGTGVPLSATGTAGATYTWMVSPTGATLSSAAGTISGTTASNTLNSTTAGVYTVSLTQTLLGCTSAPAITTFTVNNNLGCPNGDTDGDGVSNGQEAIDGTNPSNVCSYTVASQVYASTNSAWKAADCDTDGLTNAQEIDPNNDGTAGPNGTHPTHPDTDGDGLYDGEEVTGFDNPATPANPGGLMTNPNISDTDGDGVTDGAERTNSGLSDPLTAATDSCSYNVMEQILVNASSAWNALDCDDDGVPNGTDPEARNPCVPNANALACPTGDPDGDGVTNDKEVIEGTSPSNGCSYLLASQVYASTSTVWRNADCDSDGLLNGEEVTGINNPLSPLNTNGYTSNPLVADTEGDGLNDGQEAINNTNPNNSDTDGDGVKDGTEILDSTNPLNNCSFVIASQTLPRSAIWNGADCDNDGVINTNDPSPLNSCIPNASHINCGLDSDGDGVTNAQEVLDGTVPNNSCDYLVARQVYANTSSVWRNIDCDNDGLLNGEELTGVNNPLSTLNPNGNTSNPLVADTDGDGLNDGQESVNNTNPNNTDTDGDGVRDNAEVLDRTNPLESCSFLLISRTMSPSAAWSSADCDNDGIPNGTDSQATNPCLPNANSSACTTGDPDGDGVTNTQEATDGTNPSNGCSYIAASQVYASTSVAWKAADCDTDGLTNGQEVDPNNDSTAGPNGTNPRSADTDGDGLYDGEEVMGVNNPLTPANPSGLITNATNPDTDGDGVTDGVEATSSGAGDPLTDATNSCSLNKAEQTLLPSAVWTAADCDSDGTPNGTDPQPTNPCLPNANSLACPSGDTDGDGVANAQEATDGTNPNNGCSYTVASQVYASTRATWKAADCDTDGLTNAQEVDPNNDGTAGPNGTNPTHPDTDGDGVNDLADQCKLVAGVAPTGCPSDSDADGMADATDLDDDNDGILDTVENASACGTNVEATGTNADCDGDGIPNSLDLDSDSDGINDVIEAGGTDPDGDGKVGIGMPAVNGQGIPTAANGGSGLTPANTDRTNGRDPYDADADGDGILDGIEDTDKDGVVDAGETNAKNPDTDGDGLADGVEDADKDGIVDLAETDPRNPDTDGDGVNDLADQCKLITGLAPTGCPSDSDADGIADATDLDDDNDGILDAVENAAACETTVAPTGTNTDCDGDGMPNSLDLDSDGDGLKDVIEAGGSDPDGDGKVGTGTPAVNANGVPIGANSGSGLMPANTDGTNGADPYDTDADGDGILDGIEDTDKDGVVDAGETSPKNTDTDGDGLDDGVEDTDKDGIVDFTETDPSNPDTDGDGVNDLIDQCKLVAGLAPTGCSSDSDGDGIADSTDLDDDNDGILDIVENATACGTTVTATGTNADCNGDGIPNSLDLDSDGDGIKDVIEAGGSDPDGDGKVGTGNPAVNAQGVPTAANGGAGLTPPNTDGTNGADPYDTDADGDGILDGIEDSDKDGIVDPGETNPKNIDTDGDGLADGIEDADKDGIVDPTETDPGNPDTDGDGVNDLADQCKLVAGLAPTGCLLDNDGDGIADAIDLDDDNDGILDTVENTSGCSANVVATGTNADCDGDGNPNRLDLDSDGDGINDVIEAVGSDPDGDGKVGTGVPAVNTNGVPTAANGGAGLTPINTDGTNGTDPYDTDADGDGILDGTEDTDKDGVVDAGETNPRNTDTDGDGLDDGVEDADKDGIVDLAETDPRNLDTDGDGVNDLVDQCKLVAGLLPTGCPSDSDGDGIADVTDLDDDNDGILDTVENASACGTTVAATGTNADCDGDGTPNRLDLDADNDGINDVIEAGGSDPDGDGKVGIGNPVINAQGVPTAANGGVGLMPANTDGTGGADPYDTDADGDTVTDAIEGIIDTDGDAKPNYKDTDADNDGNPDNSDSNRLVPAAVNDILSAPQGVTSTINILTNDDFLPGAGITLTVISGGTATGTATFNPLTGILSYLPAVGESGLLTLKYRVCNTVPNPDVCAEATVSIAVSSSIAKLNLKVLLQGALLPTSSSGGLIMTGIMRDDLRTASPNQIPNLEPYDGLANARFTPIGGGGQTIGAGVLSVSGNDAIVDWVFVELRDKNNPSTVLKTKSALVQRDGDVVESTDGISPLTFTGAVGESYYVSVKHRNHLGAMTAGAIAMTATGTLVDFTTMTAAQTYNLPGYNGFEQVDVNGKMALWAGNTNADNKVKYVGVGNDQIPVFSQAVNYVTNTTQQYNFDFATPVYFSGDINMDAKVKYRGPNNDASFVFFNVITKYALINTGALYNYDLLIEQLP